VSDKVSCRVHGGLARQVAIRAIYQRRSPFKQYFSDVQQNK
jgi:hypothetical protein